MIFGVSVMSASRNLARIQEKGQITLPAAIRRRLGLRRGDLVAVTETPQGILITPQAVVATRALAEIGAALEEQGISLEEVIERGRAIRGRLLAEQYGIVDPDSDQP
jgi:AbrB family looped-hinge helix DNA binding protein